MAKQKKFFSLLIAFFVLLTIKAFGANPVEFTGVDTDNDKGGSIDLSFKITDPELAKKTSRIDISRKGPNDSEFKLIKSLDPSAKNYQDKSDIIDDTEYFYTITLKDETGADIIKSDITGPLKSTPQWFNKKRTINLIFTAITIFIILFMIALVRRGKEFYIREIPGIKAIEEAVGRATEMGKPCVFCPGISSISDISTLASISILSKVGETIANYNSRLIVPNFDPIVYSVIDDVMKTSYTKAGRPDAYKADDVYFLTNRQFAYASGVSGLLAREKPAANFFLGWFMAESLILSEAGAMTGAIQIAGTDSVSQVPFFIVSCDYTLIGEELYAAGAYMGKDPQLLGGLKGQDFVKLVIMICIVVFFLLKLFGVTAVDKLLIGG